jgi:hypothetical protein
MPRKPYRNDLASPPPTVKETEPRPYGRHQKSARAGRATVSVAALKRRIKTPAKRSKRDIAWALEIAGIGDGPADLSSRVRDYLSADK